MFGKKLEAHRIIVEPHEPYHAEGLVVRELEGEELARFKAVTDWYAKSMLALGKSPPPDPLRALVECAYLTMINAQSPRVRKVIRQEAERVLKRARRRAPVTARRRAG